MIGAQSLFVYHVSISEHKLTIIATDGYLVKPVGVDYIIIHSGEHYDFALKPTEVGIKRNYLIRAETLEVDLTKSVPNPSLGHIAEAILHYAIPLTCMDTAFTWSTLDMENTTTQLKSSMEPIQTSAVNLMTNVAIQNGPMV
ncbi:hypothetical protein EMCRGX_G000754 [Ephydatia muelleri]